MTRLANAAGHKSNAEAVLHLVVDHGDLRYSWSYLIDGHTLSLIMAIYGTDGHTLLIATLGVLSYTLGVLSWLGLITIDLRYS